MKKLDDQYTTFDIALRLYNLGFNDPCNATFWIGSDRQVLDYYMQENSINSNLQYCKSLMPNKITAPLWQQVIEWLDEKGIHISFNVEPNDYTYRITQGFTHILIFSPTYSKRKSCIEASILKALKMLEK